MIITACLESVSVSYTVRVGGSQYFDQEEVG